MNDDDNEDEKVGYCRPPKRTRFSKENQPARRGRKAGAHGIKTVLKELWSKKVGLKVDGVPTKKFPLPTVFDVQLQQALKGKDRSFLALIELTLRTLGADDLDETTKRLGLADAADLDAYLEDYVADRKAAQANEEIDPTEGQSSANPCGQDGSDEEA